MCNPALIHYLSTSLILSTNHKKTLQISRRDNKIRKSVSVRDPLQIINILCYTWRTKICFAWTRCGMCSSPQCLKQCFGIILESLGKVWMALLLLLFFFLLICSHNSTIFTPLAHKKKTQVWGPNRVENKWILFGEAPTAEGNTENQPTLPLKIN